MLRSAGTNAFIFFMASIFIYSFGYIYELSSDTADTIFLALKIEYLGAPLIPVLWFIFALEYNAYHFPRRLIYPALFIIPIVTMVMLHTNAHHFLHYKSFGVDTSGPFTIATTTKGIWYYVDFAYKTVFSIAGTALFGIKAIKSVGYQRKQTFIIFCGALIIWLGNIISMIGVAPYGIDINPFFLSAAVPLCTYAMFRLRMFDIVPIARDKIFNTLNTSVIVLNSEGKVVDFNDCAKSILPCLTHEILDQDLKNILPKDNHSPDVAALFHEGDGEIEFLVDNQMRCFKISSSTLRSQQNDDIGLIISLHDVTKNKAHLKRMERIASIDTLTQVYSRWFFMESCLLEIKRAWKEKNNLTFVLIDIDHFKNVNDTYGHPAGDCVLKSTANILKKMLRGGDLIGRYGGEEFAILLPNTNASGAQMLAERLREEVAATVTLYEGIHIETTISIGVASATFGSTSEPINSEHILKTLLKISDQALYEAKEHGRNQVRTAQI